MYGRTQKGQPYDEDGKMQFGSFSSGVHLRPDAKGATIRLGCENSFSSTGKLNQERRLNSVADLRAKRDWLPPNILRKSVMLENRLSVDLVLPQER